MTPTTFYYENYYENQFMPCECCKIKYSNCTTTFTARKWSKKECEEQILYLAERVATTKWYNGRSGLIKELKHWTEKLARYKELKEEFNS